MFAHALGFSVFTSPLLATDLDTNYNSLTGLRTPNVTHTTFSPQKHSSQITPRTNLNCGILTAAIFSLTQLTTAHTKSSIHTFRSSSTTNLPRLSPTENLLKTNLISPINSRSDTRKDAAFCTVADVKRCGCVTSLRNAEVTWSLFTDSNKSKFDSEGN
jgi:hypothetical protein